MKSSVGLFFFDIVKVLSISYNSICFQASKVFHGPRRFFSAAHIFFCSCKESFNFDWFLVPCSETSDFCFCLIDLRHLIMGNCCASPGSEKENPYLIDYNVLHGSVSRNRGPVLKDPTGRDISLKYELGREMGRGEFGVTYMCTEKSTNEKYACKSIAKKKLRTAVDIEDVRREVQIMKRLPKHPNIVSLKDTFEDENAVHIVMELCEGGELFDRIVSRGHYTERAAAGVMRTIVEVVQVEFRPYFYLFIYLFLVSFEFVFHALVWFCLVSGELRLVVEMVFNALVICLLFVDGLVLGSVWLLRKARSRRKKKNNFDSYNMVLFW